MFRIKAVEKIKTHFVSINFFFSKIEPFMDNVGKYCRGVQATDDNILGHMLTACWILNATDTHSEIVVLIAFPQKKWLRERASMLRCMYFIIPIISPVTSLNI